MSEYAAQLTDLLGKCRQSTNYDIKALQGSRWSSLTARVCVNAPESAYGVRGAGRQKAARG